jgi:hypothetical protein
LTLDETAIKFSPMPGYYEDGGTSYWWNTANPEQTHLTPDRAKHTHKSFGTSFNVITGNDIEFWRFAVSATRWFGCAIQAETRIISFGREDCPKSSNRERPSCRYCKGTGKIVQFSSDSFSASPEAS